MIYSDLIWRFLPVTLNVLCSYCLLLRLPWLQDATRMMMKFIIVPEFQRQYNVTGRMGKLCFKDLRLFEVFYRKFSFLIA